jgi:hypothetical protein
LPCASPDCGQVKHPLGNRFAHPRVLFRPKKEFSDDFAARYKIRTSGHSKARTTICREPDRRGPQNPSSYQWLRPPDRSVSLGPIQTRLTRAPAHSSDARRLHIKIALHFDPPSVRQYDGQPATRLLLRQRFPEALFHCHELPVGGSAFRRLPLPALLLQVAIQSAVAQTSTATKLASPHPAVHKLRP